MASHVNKYGTNCTLKINPNLILMKFSSLKLRFIMLSVNSLVGLKINAYAVGKLFKKMRIIEKNYNQIYIKNYRVQV